jgi:hypothetical protein
MAQQSLKGQGLLVFKASRSHSDTPVSVGLIWKSDQLVAEASTYEHTTFTTDRHPCRRRDWNPKSQHASGRRSSLRPRIHWDRLHGGHLLCLTLHKHRLIGLLQFLDSLLGKKLSLAFSALFVLSAPASYSSNIQTIAAFVHSTMRIFSFGVSPRRTMTSRRFGKRCSCCLKDELLTGTLRGGGGGMLDRYLCTQLTHLCKDHPDKTQINSPLRRKLQHFCERHSLAHPKTDRRSSASGFVMFRHVYFASISFHKNEHTPKMFPHLPS